ncbi:tachykinin-like peptides receptor 86C isoform X2 [Liolophura sinensis]|uniref:tachykinin-like peptides receptor 86C isoform X2 n=1 Tax=Liolophura sinensis TaxID=3198878 RepID=UPI0031583BE6
MAAWNYSAVLLPQSNGSFSTLKPPDGYFSSSGFVETGIEDDGNGTVSYGHSSGTVSYWDPPTTIVLSVILSLLIVLSIGGNLLVISVVVRHRGMRTRTNMFLVNLAIADFLVGLIPMPISLITIIHGRWIFSNAICVINGFLNALCLMTSNQLLMYISVHKYFSITRPFSRFLTVRKILMMIAAAWLWAMLCSVLTVTGLQKVLYKNGTMHCGPAYPRDLKAYIHHVIIQVTDIFIPLGVMTFCYTKIFIEIRQHTKRMRANSTLEKDTILAQQKKVTITLFIVLACFICCWLPYHVYASYVSYRKNEHGYPPIINALAYTFGYLNSACNPIIYALRSPSFREGYMEILCRKAAVVVSDDTINPSSPSFKTRFSAFIGSVRGSVRGSIVRSRLGSEVSVTGLESRHNSTSSLTRVYGSREKKASITQLMKQAPKNSKGNSIIKKDGSVVVMKDGKIVCVRQEAYKNARPNGTRLQGILEKGNQSGHVNVSCNPMEAVLSGTQPVKQNGHQVARKTDSGFQEDHCSSQESDFAESQEATGLPRLLETQKSHDNETVSSKNSIEPVWDSEHSLSEALGDGLNGHSESCQSSDFGPSDPNLTNIVISVDPVKDEWPVTTLVTSRSTDHLNSPKPYLESKRPIRLSKSDHCLDRDHSDSKTRFVFKRQQESSSKPKNGDRLRLPSVEHLDLRRCRLRSNSDTPPRKKCSPNVKRRSWFAFKTKSASSKKSRSRDNVDDPV